jgi:hypothetical protein
MDPEKEYAMLTRLCRPGLLVFATIQLAGCGAMMRQQNVEARTEEILWNETVPKYEIGRPCSEASEAIAQMYIREGYEVATQTAARVTSKLRYRNAGGALAAADDQQTTLVNATLRPSGSGCRLEIAFTDRFGGRVRNERAPNWELLIFEKLEPERVQALRTEARQRAEAEYK